MTLVRSGPPPGRRGATRRRRTRRLEGKDVDRWLDHLVTLAVLIALVVGGAALVVSLVL